MLDFVTYDVRDANGRHAHIGSQPPRQYDSVPQYPYSEQHGAEEGHFEVALHVDWANTAGRRARMAREPRRENAGWRSMAMTSVVAA
jgi:hypothetical protein